MGIMSARVSRLVVGKRVVEEKNEERRGGTTAVAVDRLNTYPSRVPITGLK